MSYLLDSTVCVAFLRSGPSAVVRRIMEERRREITVCPVVRGELLYGAWRSPRPEHTIREVLGFLEPYVSLPFDDRAADVYGRLRFEMARNGNAIGPNDMLIASIALVHGATLVTHNTREFARVRGLEIQDWEV